MTNVFKKPTGKLKGSQTMAAKGDKKGASPSRLVNNVGQKIGGQYFGSGGPKNDPPTNNSKPSRDDAMVKVMKKYPNNYGFPNAQKVVSANNAAINTGPALSQANNKRKLKYIGA